MSRVADLEKLQEHVFAMSSKLFPPPERHKVHGGTIEYVPIGMRLDEKGGVHLVVRPQGIGGSPASDAPSEKQAMIRAEVDEFFAKETVAAA